MAERSANVSESPIAQGKQAVMDIYSNSIKKVLNVIDPEQLSMDNIVLLIIKTMEIVDAETSLNGVDKKIMVLSIVKIVIRKYVTFDAIEESMAEFVDTFGGSIVDSVISVSNKRFSINQRRNMYTAMKTTLYAYHTFKMCFCKGGNSGKKDNKTQEKLDHTDVVDVMDNVILGAELTAIKTKSIEVNISRLERV